MHDCYRAGEIISFYNRVPLPITNKLNIVDRIDNLGNARAFTAFMCCGSNPHLSVGLPGLNSLLSSWRPNARGTIFDMIPTPPLAPCGYIHEEWIS